MIPSNQKLWEREHPVPAGEMTGYLAQLKCELRMALVAGRATTPRRPPESDDPEPLRDLEYREQRDDEEPA